MLNLQNDPVLIWKGKLSGKPVTRLTYLPTTEFPDWVVVYAETCMAFGADGSSVRRQTVLKVDVSTLHEIADVPALQRSHSMKL